MNNGNQSKKTVSSGATSKSSSIVNSKTVDIESDHEVRLVILTL